MMIDEVLFMNRAFWIFMHVCESGLNVFSCSDWAMLFLNLKLNALFITGSASGLVCALFNYIIMLQLRNLVHKWWDINANNKC